MSKSDPGPCAEFRFALADSIAFLNPDHWDRAAARSGLFLSRPFLRLLEQHLPGNLSTHYAIVYAGDRPVAAVVAQSLEIRIADLSPGRFPETTPGFWHSLGEASQRSISRVRKRVLLYDNLLLWPFREEAAPGELWPDVASNLWRRFRSLLKTAERAAESPGRVDPLALFNLREPALDGSARRRLRRGRRAGEALAGGGRGA